jgi:rhomboid protease GluP
MTTTTMDTLPRRIRNFPVATVALVAINVGVWLCQILAGVSWAHPGTQQLVKWGADLPLLTLTGDGWRLGASMFLHGGLVHLGLNMLVLAVTGPRSEDEFGTPRMLAIYLVGGLLASCASTYWSGLHSAISPETGLPAGLLVASVGASGAVMALLGALLAAAILGVPYSGNPEPTRTIDRGLLQVIVVNVGLGFFVHGIDQAAHIGGLTGGFVIGAIMGIAWKRSGWLVTAARFAATFALLVACLSALFHAVDPKVLMPLRAEFLGQQAADRL